MSIFKKRPSPAMIVAIAALVVSIGGTAVAGPIAEISLNRGEKKQIRKISRNISGKVSNRRITKRAPGLNVATARNAVIANVANAANFAHTATNAKNAENAENAETAENAEFAESAGFAENVFSALINSDGTVTETLDGVTAEKLGVGIYEVDFGVPIEGCTWFTALGGDDLLPQGGEVSSVPREGNPNALFVARDNSEGNAADGDFYAELNC